ncbi:MAG: MOSC domain-containing protein [Candidatus Limnocylindria bacterium]
MAENGPGSVEGIHLHGERGEPMRLVETAEVVAGQGLVGDRMAGLGIPGSHLTLIAAEGIEAMVADTGISLLPHQTRRNILTRGIDVPALVGRRFQVGEAVCYGVRECNPCNHLESLTYPGVRAGLSGRGGLRADVLSGGVIRVGDAITVLAG